MKSTLKFRSGAARAAHHNVSIRDSSPLWTATTDSIIVTNIDRPNAYAVRLTKSI